MTEVVQGADATGSRPPPSARTALLWTALNRSAIQATQLLFGVVLARLLTPAEFGVYALLTLFYYLGQTVVQSALSQAVVQSRRLDDRVLSSAFAIMLAGAVVLAGTLAVSGSLLARVFDAPALAGLAPLMALNFLANTGVVHLAQLERALRFRAIAVVELCAALLGSSVSLVLVLQDAGVRGIVIGLIVTTVVQNAAWFVLVRWRPRVRLHAEQTRALLRFLRGAGGTLLLGYVVRYADNALIGRYVGVEALGYYSRAYSLMLLPITQITWATSRVLLPVLRRHADSLADLTDRYLRTVTYLALLTVPAGAGLAVTAGPLIEVLFGDQWGESADLLRVLSIGGALQPLVASTWWLFQVRHRTDSMLRWSSAQSCIVVAGFVLALPFGADGVAWAFSVSAVALFPMNVLLAARVLEAPVGLLVRPLVRPALASGVMAAVLLAGQRVLPPAAAPVELVLLVSTGAVVYLAALLVLREPTLRAVLQRRRGER